MPFQRIHLKHFKIKKAGDIKFSCLYFLHKQSHQICYKSKQAEYESHDSENESHNGILLKEAEVSSGNKRCRNCAKRKHKSYVIE